jgi:6-pyruvoyltetrahydropterin/6-carboxytetrahydropterin synthase
MLRITKIFHFEMAHAINDYPGSCKNVHGHSYELHVTVAADKDHDYYIAAPGFITDFKELKELVGSCIIQTLDHKLLLSNAYAVNHPAITAEENLVVWEAEPTAENLLIYIQRCISKKLDEGVRLVALKLYETKDSYAEWNCDHFFNRY